MKAQFVFAFATRDGVVANLHAFSRGDGSLRDGSLRDNNHVLDVVRVFARGTETIMRPPAEDERVMFEGWVTVEETRHGTSTYHPCEYRQRPPCPQCVAEAGMEIVAEIRHMMRRLRRDKVLRIAAREAKEAAE